MPYIEQNLRKRIDPTLDELIWGIKLNSAIGPMREDGVVNYIVTRILKELYEPKYYNYNRAIGVLECIKQEFYRRDVAPYEDTKIEENGDIKRDVWEYQLAFGGMP